MENKSASVPCKLCGNQTEVKVVQSRDNRHLDLYGCLNCDFNFFIHSPQQGLQKSKLDSTRLESVGIFAGPPNKKLSDARLQAKVYLKHFRDELNAEDNLLDFGCGAGGFLKETIEMGCNSYGIEIDEELRTFVKKKVTANCFPNVSQLPNIEFDKIFSFYVLEYVEDIKGFFDDMWRILKPGGQLFLVTPNHNDFLSSVVGSDAFNDFIYEYYSINYFTEQSLNKLFTGTEWTKVAIYSKQGYSLFNHLNWLVNQRPTQNKFVGEDTLFDNQIKPHLLGKGLKTHSFLSEICQQLEKIDSRYKKEIENLGLANQLWLSLTK